jgi:hypothetical protein
VVFQLVKADQDNAEAIARLQEEAKTLRVALTAQTKRVLPPSPANAISGPFMEAIKGSVALQVQEQVLPIVAQIRGEMERVAKTRDVELYEKLRDKLEQSSKMSQLLSTWIESNPDDAHQTLAKWKVLVVRTLYLRSLIHTISTNILCPLPCRYHYPKAVVVILRGIAKQRYRSHQLLSVKWRYCRKNSLVAKWDATEYFDFLKKVKKWTFRESNSGPLHWKVKVTS